MCSILQVQFRLVRETGGARKLVALRDLNPGELIFSEAIIDIYLIFVGNYHTNSKTSLIERGISILENSSSRRQQQIQISLLSKIERHRQMKQISNFRLLSQVVQETRKEYAPSVTASPLTFAKGIERLQKWGLCWVLSDAFFGNRNMQLNTVKYYQILSNAINQILSNTIKCPNPMSRCWWPVCSDCQEGPAHAIECRVLAACLQVPATITSETSRTMQ